MSKLKSILIYVHTPSYIETDGGTVVQFYLAQLLDELGHNVRIHSRNNKVNPFFNKFYKKDLNLDNTVVIYCEGIVGNPLRAKYVVRWILSELGKNVPINRLKTWNKNELVYYFNSEKKIVENKDKIGTIYKFLTTLYLNPDIKNYNNIKDGYCFTIRKKHFYTNINYIHPKDSFEIIKSHNQNDYITFFNKYKYFISYDPLTFLINIATICGCISIVYPLENITKLEWIGKTSLIEYFNSINKYELYGVAYGNSEEEIKFAESTVHLAKEQWDNILSFYKNTHIKKFINDINNFENMENTIANNF